MNPCLADTGSNISLLVVGFGILLVGLGVALFFAMRRGHKKAGAGAALAALLLVGGVTLGNINVAPAQADTITAASCVTPAATATTTAPTQTPTTTPVITPSPTTTPTPTPTPTPTCSAMPINIAEIEWDVFPDDGSISWTSSILTEAEVTQLTELLGTDTTFDGHFVITAEDGTELFNADVNVIMNQVDSGTQLVVQLENGIGPNPAEAYHGTAVLTATFANAQDCPVSLTVDGTVPQPA